MRSSPRPLAAIAAMTLVMAAAASPAVDTSPDPALDARVQRLAAELRCLVCQNQSLADSHAELAIDLKNQVREQLAAGRSDDEVVAYMTERYGDFVRYRPPFKAATWLLWLGPLLLMAGGGVGLWRVIRLTSDGNDDEESADELARARRLLDSSATSVD